MWKLTIEDDEGKQTSIPLGHDEYGLGRDKANTIRLTDRNVSRRHAKLRKDEQGWHVQDLDSYNGTYVNGVRVQGEQLLSNGDVVQLGDYRLEFIDDSQVTNPGDLPNALPPAHLRPNRLVVVVGPNPGAEFPLDREHITLGRAEEAMISINHSSVSRMHADMIALGGGRFEVIDKNSANGIRVNGVELKRGILEAGDALELGDVRLRFVGAGKIFRAADHTQQLAAVGPLDGVSAKAGVPQKRASKGMGTAIGVAIAICLLGTAVAVFAMRGSKSPVPPRSGANETTAPRSNDAEELVRIARHLLDVDKDLEAAHQTLQDVPEDSPLRDDPDFKAIEAKWAESMFAQVEEAKDPKDKRALLYKIAVSPSVDAESRKKAADMVQELDKTLPPDPNRPPAIAFVSGRAPAAAAAPKANALPSAPLPSDALDPANIKKNLENKVWSGRGTISEIRMLKAACSQLRDMACRDRAAALLKAKMSEQP